MNKGICYSTTKERWDNLKIERDENGKVKNVLKDKEVFDYLNKTSGFNRKITEVKLK